VSHSEENEVAYITWTAITHRDLDSEGIWWCESASLILGYRRLSVLDLAPASHQPMLWACSRYVIVFKGEIYNHLVQSEQLAQQDEAPQWRGHSDTETLPVCFAAWPLC
jgi:asparagine synthase (glutamine-hydrolysing)